MFQLRPAVLGALAAILLASPNRSAADPIDCEGVQTAPGVGIELQLLSSTLSAPVDVQHAPSDDDRLFVVEQVGRIRLLDLSNDTFLRTPFLDLTDDVNYGGERGLLGLAFHPNYATNGEFFVHYSRDGDGDTTVSRFRVSEADPNVANATSEEVLLRVNQPFGNHNGGQIAFSPVDGYLYIALGDGGSGGDPDNYGQNPRSLLGKMLRIDVDSGSPYAVPADNPFVDDPNTRDEIWALGLRNPWRFSFDSLSGDMYIADVGQNKFEEIDYQPADSTGGENYGWRVLEATDSFNPGTAWGPGVRTAPLYEIPQDPPATLYGESVTGGYVYRGCALPDFQGRYIFADYDNDWVASFRVVDGQVTDIVNHTSVMNASIPGEINRPTSFGVDARGNMYLVDHNERRPVNDGRLYRIVSTNPPNDPPTARVTPTPDPAEVTLWDDEGEVTLDGTSSDDGDGGTQELTYSWEQVAGPEGGSEIAREGKESTIVRLTIPGSYTFRLTVDDGFEKAMVDVDVEALPDPRTLFRRGDSNIDQHIDISDGTYILGMLFRGFPVPSCEDTMDINDTGDVDLSDAVYLFSYLFTGGARPAPPGAVDCGRDPTDDDGLGCDSYAPCD